MEKNSSVPGHQQLKSHYEEISKIQVSLLVEASVFMQAAKKKCCVLFMPCQ
jgi:hypothetical protein